MYWIPEGKLERGNDDKNAGAKYTEWAQKGMLRICDGNYLNTSVVADWFLELYKKYGTVAVLLSAFTPIPYNIFTIASGILKMNFLKFTLASIAGRGGRFFLVSIVLMLFGEVVKQYLNFVIIFGTFSSPAKREVRIFSSSIPVSPTNTSVVSPPSSSNKS